MHRRRSGLNVNSPERRPFLGSNQFLRLTPLPIFFRNARYVSALGLLSHYFVLA